MSDRMTSERERSIDTRGPRDVLADRIEQWADTEDWKVYDYVDRLLRDLDDAGYVVVRAPKDDVGMFTLVRDVDVTGVSGTGVVAYGCEFPNGVVALQWTSEWPTSVVFHDRGMESVEAIHGHGGATRIEWLLR